MNWKNSSDEYGRISKGLHWLLAFWFIGLFALGVWMVGLSYYDPWYHSAPAYHKTFGVLAVILMLVRWLWHRWSPPPTPCVGSDSKLSARSIHRMHQLFYLWVLALGVSGYLISTGEGHDLELLWGLSMPALPWQIGDQTEVAGEIHEWLAYGFIVFASAHALAALHHHFRDHLNTLNRML